MNYIYSSTNKIKFTNISETYKVNRSVKGLVSDLHSSVVTYVISHFTGTMAYKQKTVKVLNIITYAVYASENLPLNWRRDDPLVNIPDIDDEQIEEVLGDIYLTVEAIDWDIQPVDSDTVGSFNNVISSPSKFRPITTVTSTDPAVKPTLEDTKDITVKETPSTDLYIQAPEIPQFDITKPWIQKQCDADLLTIYTTFPEIPQRQRDIA